MSSYKEGQTHQLLNKLEAEGFTADDITLLGQSQQLSGILSVLHGNAEIIPVKHVLKRRHFDPVEFSGKNYWSIAERNGMRVGESLDAGNIVGKAYLNEGETFHTGEERYNRIKAASSDVQLDGADFLALWEEKSHKTLTWLYETKGINWLSCWGTILRLRDGFHFILYLYRGGDGSWHWDCCKISGSKWNANCPSAVIAMDNNK